MADEIIVKYQADVKGAEKSLNSYIKTTEKVDSTTKKTTKDVEKSYTGMSQSVTASLKSVAGAVGIAFGTQQILSFGKEAVQLAGKMQGVERAFNKLNKPDLLSNLRKATRGTVTDLELMRQAVRAQNFQVPLEKLASFFEFATKRSIETGESVDYLVSSIIDGIGRKSTLVLDNLGISATQLQAEIKKTGDFGEAAANIISRSLEETGDVADTTAIKIEQLNTTLENTKTAIGVGLIQGTADLTDELGQTGTAIKDLADETDGSSLATTAFQKIIETVSVPIRLLNGYIQSQVKLLTFWKDILGITGDEMEDVTTKAEGLAGIFAYMRRQTKESGEESVVTGINALNDELKDFNERLKSAVVGSTQFFDLTEKIADKTKELNEALAQTKLQDAFILDEDDPFIVFDDGLVDIENGVERATNIATEVWQRHFDELMSLQDEAFQNEVRNREESEHLNRTVLESTLSAWSTFTNLAANLTDQQYQRQYNSLDKALKEEQITREEYDRRRAALAKEQFKKDKEAKLIQASINTALGVTNAIATAPNIIVGLVLAAVAAAAGAAEIAVIASAPTPQFAEGGWVSPLGRIHGRSHAQGGVTIEAEGDEYITRGKYAMKNAKLLEAINSGNSDKFIMENHTAPIIESILSGGMGAIGDSARLNAMFSDRNMLRAFDRNRQSERDSAKYIVNGITKGLSRKSNDRYV